jgi:competence protein ComEC
MRAIRAWATTARASKRSRRPGADGSGGAPGRAGPVTAALSFSLGVGIFHALGAPPPFWLPVGLLLVLAPAALRWRPLRPAAFLAAGVLWAQTQACAILCDPFPEALVREDIRVEGRVASLPEDLGRATRFLFRVEQARHGDQELKVQGLVRLSWYGEAPPIRAGERRALVVRLKPPHGFANPGGFDYERWLFQEGVRATGYVRKGGEAQLLDAGAGPYFVDRWRQHLRDRLLGALEGGTASGLLLALVLGDRSGIEPAQWEALTRTGTNHLIAISGLHVGLVAASVFFVVRLLWSRSARLVLLLAAPRAGALGALAGALAYSALAGFAVSTQRALVMLAVVLGALFWSRTLRPGTGIALALAAVLIVDPQAVLSYGFWLSFGAVAALLYGLGNRPGRGGLWSRWGKAQWVVALGLLPLLLLSFGRASLVSPLVNLLAVPLFSLVLLPMVLVSAVIELVFGFTAPLAWMASLLAWLLQLLASAAAWEWASASIAWRPAWVWAAAFAGIFLLLSPRGLPGRWLAAPLLLPLVLVRPPAPTPGEAWLRLLDVGQGLSVVVRTAGHTLVYDTGPAFPSGFNTGSAVVLPFLREAGVDTIDTLVLSHGDGDHAGGFEGLVSGIHVRRILAGEPGEVEDPRARPCLAGQRWTWDGVDFHILHPAPGGGSGNDSSCVLRVVTAGATALLPGDIERRVERELAAQPRGSLSADVLVAAHHGSDTSSSQPFLQAVAPRWVLYASGYANRFDFPSPEVQDRVASVGAEGLDTARTGSIWFALSDQGLRGPRLHRVERPRIWSRRDGSPGAF